jgi:L-aspartate oxidase
LVRDAGGLQNVLSELDKLQKHFGIPAARRDALELANMLVVARLIVQASLTREESRGAHFRSDFPQPNLQKWQRHIVLKQKSGQLHVETVTAG